MDESQIWTETQQIHKRSSQKIQETFTNRAKDQTPNKKLVLMTNSKLEPIRKGIEEGLKQ